MLRTGPLYATRAVMSGSGRELPPPERLTAEAYPFASAVAVRYADLDTNRHVNNVAIAELCEEARSQFFLESRRRAGPDAAKASLLVVELRIRYLAQIRYPATVQFSAGLSHIGRSSFTLAQGLFVKNQCVALADAVCVYSDGSKALPIPDDWRAAFAALTLAAG